MSVSYLYKRQQALSAPIRILLYWSPMPRPPAAELHRDLARSIVEHLRASAAEPGQVLSETGLAQAVGTSRSPVRGALQRLLGLGVLERRDDGRLVLSRLPAAGEEIAAASDGEAGVAERLYWRVAADRVAGALPDLVGEAGLVRRYGVPRGAPYRRAKPASPAKSGRAPATRSAAMRQ